ncbi:putative membrane protein YdbT with pleckstrin-like domain [Deinobacterium chartae]|uniref:Putative membrane protein YdbT with pleckstrin-like domain n=1 Tax=Deinobacterium chartae TaxID=521158 RepID=A0A841HX48_9DEIO|nr:hypothetical protein [Deinobacterium chartae]MBB6096819.1 putative membrane protein YdbT with pleckstrin-like domain [Deinobacterium chartae]
MRRLPPRTVLTASVIAMVVALVAAVLLYLYVSWWAALIPAVLTVWFGVDAYRALGWVRQGVSR